MLGRFGLNGLDIRVEDGVARDGSATVVVLCAGCHRIVHAAADDHNVNLELSPYAELRYAWRPTCPHCRMHRAMPILWGLPAGPPPDDVALGGCIVDSNPDDWQCRACGHRWSDRT